MIDSRVLVKMSKNFLDIEAELLILWSQVGVKNVQIAIISSLLDLTIAQFVIDVSSSWTTTAVFYFLTFS